MIDASRVEIGPPGLSPARRRLASFVDWTSCIPGPLAGLVSYVLAVFLMGRSFGQPGVFAAAVLGVPAAFAVGHLVGGTLDFYLAIPLLEIIEKTDQRERPDPAGPGPPPG